jgi:tetratricopeptide (TPR) repeat protein
MKKAFLIINLMAAVFAAYAQDGTPSIEELSAMIRREPDAQNYFMRAMAYTRLGMTREAIDDLSRVIVLEPRASNAYYSRALLYFMSGNNWQAFEDCNKCIGLEPEAPNGYALRGFFFLNIGQYEDALADVGKALSIDGQYRDALHLRGVIYIETERYEDAVFALDIAVGAYPQDIELYNARGMAYLRMGKFREAIADMTKEIELTPEPNRAVAYRNRAKTYLDLAAQTRDARQKAEYERLAEEDYKMMEKLGGTRD